MKITPELLADLKRKAEEVDPKDYALDESYDICSASNPTLVIAQCGFADDAEYIAAANPQVILALIKHIEYLNK